MKRRRKSPLLTYKIAAVLFAGAATLTLAATHSAGNTPAMATPPATLAHIAQRNHEATVHAIAQQRETAHQVVGQAEALADARDQTGEARP